MIKIRPATEADMGAIQAIYANYVLNSTASFEEEPPDVAEMSRRYADIIVRGLPYLVAEAKGKTVGFAYAGPFRSRSAYRYTLEDSIYVSPDAVGKGVGRALLGAIIERCGTLGYRQMIGVIGDSTNLASIKLHETLGFRKEGVLKSVGYKFGRWIDVVIMHKTLGAPDAPPPGGKAGEE
jgi:L-amino acid N-acyltransferase YncA